jgi:hypothetical protein
MFTQLQEIPDAEPKGSLWVITKFTTGKQHITSTLCTEMSTALRT